MLKLKKNFYSLVSILILVSSLLAACSNSAEEFSLRLTQTYEYSAEARETPTTGATDVQESPTATATRLPYLDIDPAKLDGISIEFLHPWTGETALLVQGLVNDFNKHNEWGIHVDGESAGGSDVLLDILETRLAANDMPDLVVLYPFQAQRLEGDYYWLDISKYIADPEWGLSEEELDDIPEVYLRQNQVGSGLLGFPAAASATALFYNRTWANELGFDTPPTTPEELKQQVCAAASSNLQDKDFNNDGTGGLLIDRSPAAILSWVYAFGGQLPLENETLHFNTQAGLDSFGYVKSIYDENGQLLRCAWLGRQPTPYDYFATRYALVYGGKLEDITLQTQALLRAQNSDEWIVIPYPSPDGSGTLLVDGLSYVITVAEPETQLAAWLFTRWMISSEVQRVFIEANGTWPVRLSTVELLQDYQQAYPQWDDLMDMLPEAYYGPLTAQWQLDRLVLEDAFWQYLQGDADRLPDILELLDATIQELSEIYADE